MENSAQLPEVITSENVQAFEFKEYRKKVLSRISTFTVPAGTSFETPEGLKAEDEETRIAFDSQGGVYPIRESVFQETYEEVPEDELQKLRQDIHERNEEGQ